MYIILITVIHSESSIIISELLAVWGHGAVTEVRKTFNVDLLRWFSDYVCVMFRPSGGFLTFSSLKLCLLSAGELSQL